jgi:hypothetical protein
MGLRPSSAQRPPCRRRGGARRAWAACHQVALAVPDVCATSPPRRPTGTRRSVCRACVSRAGVNGAIVMVCTLHTASSTDRCLDRALPEVVGSTQASPSKWKFVLFSDLHVSAATIDRCITTLGLIRDLSREESAPETPEAPVVFLGDFWHHRHSLQVRHVDRCAPPALARSLARSCPAASALECALTLTHTVRVRWCCGVTRASDCSKSSSNGATRAYGQRSFLAITIRFASSHDVDHANAANTHRYMHARAR